ncbi:MAG: DUF4105 domain-containing protein [Bacteroidaceae bacterium]|nr:DUF4105 domain-containing protein [Bacteroidaceae bacterium]
MKKFVLLFLLLPLCALAEDKREISLLTCSPGEQVYELFGHTAIRVTDPARGVDVVFNYGLFSFDEPNFVWRFVRGETDYLLGCVDFQYFIAEYGIRGSGVTEQVLALDSLQKNRIIEALATNSLPKNRVYRYNFLFNNCTTKARDKILEAVGEKISYATSSVGDSLSFRDIVHIHTTANEWYQFGMDLLLGAPADKIAKRSGAQFAPFVLMREFADATITTGDSARRLVAKQHELLLPEKRVTSRNNLTPFNVSLLLLLFTLVVMLCERRSGRTFWLWDMLLMLMQAISGTVLLFMVLFSQHPAVDCNWLLLWLNPLPFVLLPILLYRIGKGASMGFMWIQVIMPALFIVASPLLPQCFPVPIYICAITVIIRSLFYIYKDKICALDVL